MKEIHDSNITSLEDLEQRFKLSPTDNDLFFQEWQQDLPDLTSEERSHFIPIPILRGNEL